MTSKTAEYKIIIPDYGSIQTQNIAEYKIIISDYGTTHNTKGCGIYNKKFLSLNIEAYNKDL